MKSWKYGLFLPIWSLAGCMMATMVTPPGAANTPNAPVNEATRPGVVKYRNDGLGSVREQRRNDAYTKMAEACGGKYTIDAEGGSIMSGAVVANQTSDHNSRYWFIQFSCIRDTSATH